MDSGTEFRNSQIWSKDRTDRDFFGFWTLKKRPWPWALHQIWDIWNTLMISLGPPVLTSPPRRCGLLLCNHNVANKFSSDLGLCSNPWCYLEMLGIITTGKRDCLWKHITKCRTCSYLEENELESSIMEEN